MAKTRPGLLQIGAGNMFASMILAGLMLGYVVDVWLDKQPLFMLAFGVLGMIGGMIKVHAMLKHQRSEQEEL